MTMEKKSIIVFKKKYVVLSVLCLFFILILLFLGMYCSNYYWKQSFYKEGMLYYDLFVYFIPCLLESCIFVLSGIMAMAIVAYWYDVKVKKRKCFAMVCFVELLLYGMFFGFWVYEIFHLYNSSYRFLLFYFQWWRRLLGIWFPSIILGVSLFLCFNGQTCPQADNNS